jgi:hypothetical protein
MSRIGAEPKPPWQQVPAAVRQRTEAVLGARVQRAARIWGGYAPSPTFRLRLDDGRRAFFKGTNPDSNDFMRAALEREERVYRRIPHLISPWAPAFYGSFRQDGWHVLLLEDLGPANVPPWTAARARRAMRLFAAFHASSLGQSLPRWLPRRAMWGRFGLFWRGIAEEPGQLEAVVGLAVGREADARAWLRAALPALRQRAEALTRVRSRQALLHFDARSDNIRLGRTELRLFDWPFTCVGPPELDATAFAQSVACEGGPAPELLMRWYAEALSARDEVVDASVVAIAGFFANRAPGPPIPGLPRVRSIQRRQLKASLAWAARRLGLPDPAWLEAVAD